MANYNTYKLNPPKNNPTWPPGSTNFSTEVVGLINACEEVEQEVEDAREDENTVIENLNNNYIKYTLGDNILGVTNETYRFINMADATAPNDYVNIRNVEQEIGIPSLDLFNTAAEVGVPPFYANDLYKVSSDDASMNTFIRGYGNTALTGTFPNSVNTPKFNCTYIIDYSTTPAYTIYLNARIPVFGDEIKFLLLGYDTTDVNFYSTTYKIMKNNYFTVDQGLTASNMFSYIHFTYVGNSVGWYLRDITQRE